MQTEIDLSPFVSYHVTGTDARGRRFRTATRNAVHAFGVNLWRGSVWGVLPTGHRKLLRRVYN
jgi:hypothetical protein